MNIKIGAKIKELRKRDNVTQEQLAECLGVTSQAISKWESENGYPDIEYISPIADFFNVTTDYLLNHSRRKQGLYKILIIDDVKMRDAFCAILQPDYELVFGESGSDAVKCAAKEQPDLILIDTMTEKIDNYGSLEALKDSEVTRDIPVIVVSGHGCQGQVVRGTVEATGEVKEFRVLDIHVEQCIRAGASDYVVKPLTPELLRARIAEQLRKPVTQK
jgi:CheY-like chemotaxis protein